MSTPNIAISQIRGTQFFTTGQFGVTTTAAKMLPFNALRRSLTIVNGQSLNIWIGGTSAVTTSTGLQISANGGSVSIDTKAEIWAISSAGTQTICYAEVGEG